MCYTRHAASVLIGLVFSWCSIAATLKPESKEAWDAYLQQATAAMQARIQPGAHFLWLEDEPDRLEHVRTIGPYIVTVGHIPRHVPSGLIHDWLGAGYIPNVTIADILQVVRDYDHYSDVYHPGVIQSRLHNTDGMKDSFFLRFANRSVVSKTALDSEGEATYVQLDEHRWYAFSNTIHIREIDKLGTPKQHTLPEDEGTGYIWRLSSITRLEERDGGVYAELEALALSRDIPAAFRAFASPIVRRVSRDSLATSLHQTKLAIEAKKTGHTVNVASVKP
jgi:hypothetical protein